MIKIEQNTPALKNGAEIMADIKSKNEGFGAMLEKVEKFKKDLEELGPLRLAIKLNMDKIKEKVEEKRAELTELYDVANLSGDEKKKTIAAIEEMLEAYKKQLLEQMRAAKELEEQGKKEAQKSVGAKVDVMSVFAFMDAKNVQQSAREKAQSTLKSLLQDKQDKKEF